MIQDYYYLILSYVLYLAYTLFSVFGHKVNFKIGSLVTINASSLLFVFFSISIFGFRSYQFGNDTQGYVRYYEALDSSNIDDIAQKLDVFFVSYMRICKFFLLNTRVFLLSISFFFSVLLCRIVNSIFKSNADIVLFLYYCSFFYVALETNIIRSSISVIIWMWGIHYMFSSRTYLGLLLVVLASGFHFTSILVLVCGVFSLNVRHIKWLIGILPLIILVSYRDFNLFDYLPDIENLVFIVGKMNSYKDPSMKDEYLLGFRIDFVIFNLFFILWGIKFRDKLDSYSDQILCFYLLSTIVFYLSFNIPFNDRVGLQSWILIPFILVLPFRKDMIGFRYKVLFILISIAMACFTLLSLKPNLVS